MNMNFDKELITKYLVMFKVSAIILGITLVAGIALLAITIPQIGNYFHNSKKLKETKASIEQKQAELTRIKDDIAREEAEKLPDNEMKVFYRDIRNTDGLTADILAGEVQEINELLRYYGIKVYRINYTYDSENDVFYKGKKEKYSSCKMDLELFANYMKFQGFLKDLYKHEHFLDISFIEVKPYKKDKSVLNIKLTLNLYAEKDGSSSPRMNDNSNMNTEGSSENTDMPPSDSEVTIEF